MGLLKEFKEFALRGNVVDLAVGVIIGAAFGSIVNSLVKDVLMPPIGYITGGVDFKDKFVTLKPEVTDATGKVLVEANKLNYGNFLNAVINFVIVAFCIFALVKLMNTLKRTTPPPPEAPAPPTKTEMLLTEIRDSLRAR
jgi:large conductance mechanosensitive channel